MRSVMTASSSADLPRDEVRIVHRFDWCIDRGQQHSFVLKLIKNMHKEKIVEDDSVEFTHLFPLKFWRCFLTSSPKYFLSRSKYGRNEVVGEHTLFDLFFNVDYMTEVLDKLDASKGTGRDLIQPNVLSDFEYMIAEPLISLIHMLGSLSVHITLQSRPSSAARHNLTSFVICPDHVTIFLQGFIGKSKYVRSRSSLLTDLHNSIQYLAF
ncbi:hypothetical protein J6590_072448 [Homalodisca vitripennis]|nr:hypothetical protein J6590_072448 [Homalodisca vitripennis]